MGRFEKGNKIGNRFSSENQPPNAGRKPKVYQFLKDTIGQEVGHELEEKDFQNIMRTLLEMPNDRLQSLIRSKERDENGKYKPNPKTPVWIMILASHINNCIRNGKMDALDSVLDRVFGKNENLNISVGSFESFLKELPDNPEDLDK